jgi:hypothetical protein
VGLGLLAAAIGVVAFVRYRERETASLHSDVTVARELRELAAGDDVRIAAVDEFELAIYQRLFYASVVGPRVRSAAWSLLGAALALTAALATADVGGILGTVVHILAVVVGAVFGVSTLFFTGLAIFHAATTPRVSFAESYGVESDD